VSKTYGEARVVDARMTRIRLCVLSMLMLRSKVAKLLDIVIDW
jgi:hypothetical protein